MLLIAEAAHVSWNRFHGPSTWLLYVLTLSTARAEDASDRDRIDWPLVGPRSFSVTAHLKPRFQPTQRTWGTYESQAPGNRNRAVVFPAELKFLRFKIFWRKKMNSPNSVSFLLVVQFMMQTKFNFSSFVFYGVCLPQLGRVPAAQASSLTAVIGPSNNDVISLRSSRSLRCARCVGWKPGFSVFTDIQLTRCGGIVYASMTSPMECVQRSVHAWGVNVQLPPPPFPINVHNCANVEIMTVV